MTSALAQELAPAVPPLPPALVSRDRLLASLDGQADRPLTLVGAPAGSGKTVLLSEWAGARGAAWLSLGPHHREVGRLWRDLIGALRAAGVPVAVDPPGRSLDEGFALRLADALAGPGRPALVLDDLHVLRGPAVQALGDLVAYGGNRLRLLVTTRADPDLPLQRMRLQGRLGELRAADLAFDEDEAAALLEALGVPLEPDQVARLVGRTEGWAAGLSLAGMSLRGDPDPDAFITGFAGDDRAVADYLTGEVLATQSPAVREFLLRTSVADRVCGGLADALTGGGHGARTLAELERAGMFLVPLDRHGTWFRYYAVFGELLRARLRLEWPELERDLHAQASAWLAADGQARAAVRHAVAAVDPDVMGRLMAEHWLELLMDVDRPEAVIEAAERMPAEERLAVAAAQASMCQGDPAAALVRLDRVGVADAEVAGFAALLRARASDDVAACRAAAGALVASAEDDRARALALMHLGAAEFAAGSPEAAGEDLEAAAAIAAEEGFEGVLLPCLGRSAALELIGGRLGRAEAAAQHAIAFAEPRGRLHGAAAAWALASLAAVHWHRDQLDDAERRADAAAAAAHVRRDDQALMAVRGLRAHLAAAHGDADRARALLHGIPAPAPGSLLVRWIEALGPAPWADGPDGVAAAAARLAAGDPLGAQRRLAPALLPGSGVHGSARVHAWLVDAGAHQALGDGDAAGRALEQALELAAQDGYRRPFADGGPAVRRLLERHVAAITAQGPLVAELLDALEPARGAAGGLLEPLSERERAVLRLLPTLLSNTEIAGELFVSVNTVKTHVKSVYRKLDVRSRREAVGRARQLRLI